MTEDNINEAVKKWLTDRQNESLYWEEMSPVETIEVLLDAWANNPASFDEIL